MEEIGDTDDNGVAASSNETLVDGGILTCNRPYGLDDPFPCSYYLKID